MATISDNVMEMAQLVKTVKRATQLNETTIMRIVDMTISLAQQAGPVAPPIDPEFDFPEGEEIPLPDETPTETPTEETEA
jgi:hypothetical protein